VTVPLDGIDLVVFDKDGTLIEFGAMWAGWAAGLAESLRAATGLPIAPPLFAMLGYDPATRAISPHGGLAATPMTRLRDRTRAILVAAGLGEAEAEGALEVTWHAPDPVALARPLGDLAALFGRLHDDGRRVAVATSDDRDATERTLAALGVANLVDAIVCADEGIPVKPAPEMVLHLCAVLGVAPGRTAVVGDSPADLAMAHAAGAGLTVGVLTGVGARADLEPLADAVIVSVEQLFAD
jgi:phosphoglycolate phosphatase-like HAD superfamily hydrolase